MCLRVCPFADGNLNEEELGKQLFQQISDIKFSDEIGYFQSCYAGYSNIGEQRSQGASGGMATWFLTELLNKNIVDHVICVTTGSSPDPLFQYVVCDNIEQVRLAAKSAYYPVEMSDVLNVVQENEGRYAIICLPCYSKSIRLACKINRKLAERIVFLGGLVCGHAVNRYFAEYAIEKAGGSVKSMERIIFRTKNPSRPATDFGTDCYWRDSDGTVKNSTTYWRQGMDRAWNGFWFVPNPCLYCDDIFAETADIAFMDAWLKEYIRDYRGTNLIAVRSELAARICSEGLTQKAVDLEPCSAKDVIKSQRSVIENKRDGLSYRLWIAQKKKMAPVKRVQPFKAKGALRRLTWMNRMRAVEIGSTLWQDRTSITTFESQINKFNRWKSRIKKIQNIVFPFYRVLGKVKRTVRMR